ncbi:MAG: hypothetical protein M0Z63_01235 [Actinomycetota bacterium]|jgi:uncharacterized repeat protein (TIGR01451 family)|nr:hypothetical protein [Actinomycetota bacterium]
MTYLAVRRAIRRVPTPRTRPTARRGGLLTAVRMAVAVATVGGTALALNLNGSAAFAASVKPTVTDFSQCANDPPPSTSNACPYGPAGAGGWINGILQQTNSHYSENQAVPQRAFLDFPAGSQTTGETITIKYDTLKGDIHAYDSLATYNSTQTGITPTVLCAGAIQAACSAVVAAGPMSTFPIPNDPTKVAPSGAGISEVTSAHQLPGQVMTLYGGTITAISTPVHTGSGGSDQYATQTVTFNLVGAGATTATDQQVLLAFSGHLALGAGPTGWGTGLGAGSVSGGPYHISLVSAGPAAKPTTFGSRDNQIMGNALAPPATPTITTTARPTSGVAGTAAANVGDTATFTGFDPATPPTGSVTFTLYSDPTCAAPVPGMSGSGPISTVPGSTTATWEATSWTPPAAGTYYWQATYPGDANNTPVTTACGAANEEIVVAKARPTITTLADPTSGVANIAISAAGDTATFHGAASPTGSVTFTLYSNPTCTTAVVGMSGSGTISTSGAVTTATWSAGWTPPAAGTYYWQATYPGDANNDAVTTACGGTDEQIAVSATAPKVTTVASPTAGTVGTPIAVVGDTATVTGAPGAPPTGSVTFTLYSDPTCTTAVFGMSGSGTISTSHAVSTATWSTAWTPRAAGTYYWQATYSGYTTACGAANEEIVVSPVSPTITTVATPQAGVAGTPIAAAGDTATFHGTTMPAPTGSVTFTLYSDPTCTAAVVGMSGSGTISTSHAVSTATWSAGWTPPAAGTYYWQATYPGDANNDAVTTACGGTDEQIVVTQAKPTITTVATPQAGVAGTPIAAAEDTATFHGAASPTGSVTFTLYSNPTCTTAVAGMSGSGTITTSGAVSTATWSAGWTPPAAGTYYWQATYPGDANNDAVTTACGGTDEQIVVATAPPSAPPSPPASPTTLSTQQSASPTGPGSMPLGGTVTDTATVTGTPTVGPPTGQVAFTVCGPGSAAALCPTGSGTTVGSAPLSRATAGSSTATSPTFTPTAVGTYCFSAVYVPDGATNYTASSGNVSGSLDTGECVTVASTAPAGSGEPVLSVVKSSMPASGSTVRPGTAVTYTLTLTNAGTAPASGVTVTDTVPAGATYQPGSATCDAIASCTVSEGGGVVRWIGVSVAAPAGSSPGTATLTFEVTVNAADGDGQVIANTAAFTNEHTPSCTTATCTTNTVHLTVVAPAIASQSSGPAPVVKAASSTSPTAATPATAIAGATTVHTGKPWAGSQPIVLAVLTGALAFLGLGERRRRRSHRQAHEGGSGQR